MFIALLSALALAHLVSGISWGLVLDQNQTSGNVWTGLQFTITVPPAPSSAVTNGPWFFWAGLQPGLNCNSLGVVQPVLQWGEYPSCAVDSEPWFDAAWQLVQWGVPAAGHNSDQSDISCGIWAAAGDTIWNNVTYANGQWTQTSNVTSGEATGQTITQTLQANQFFCTDPAGNSNANFFILESELYGSAILDWNFDVKFENVTLTAQTSTGVSALCRAQTSFTDGNGFATINGYSLSSDQRTCTFASVTLSPP